LEIIEPYSGVVAHDPLFTDAWQNLPPTLYGLCKTRMKHPSTMLMVCLG